MTLSIEINLLTGHYCAFNNQKEIEDFPDPMRLCCAIVSAHKEKLCEYEKAVLKKFEALPPPNITVGNYFRRKSFFVYVPPNPSPLYNHNKDISKIEEELKILKNEISNTNNKIEKKEEELLSLLKKESHEMTHLNIKNISNNKFIKKGEGILNRSKRQREFPSVYHEDQKIIYVYNDADFSDEEKTILDQICKRIDHIGNSHSFVSVVVSNNSPKPTYISSYHGKKRFRVPQKGTLEMLENYHKNYSREPNREMPCNTAPYHYMCNSCEKYKSELIQTSFDNNPIILEQVSGPLISTKNTQIYADKIKKALMSWAKTEYGYNSIPEILSGHKTNSESSARNHISIVPLPYIGSYYADGCIRGAAIIFPNDINGSEYNYINKLFDNNYIIINGIKFRVQTEKSISKTLNFDNWCGPANCWASATPVALDRDPGNLFSIDQKIKEKAHQKAIDCIKYGCENIGLPEPNEVKITPNPVINHALKSTNFYFYKNKGRRRVLINAIIKFDKKIMGPIIIGAGRYYGIGLFKPINL